MKYELYEDQFEREQPMSTTPTNGRHSVSPDLKHRSESPLSLISPKVERCSPPLTVQGLHIPEHLSIRPVPMKSLTSPQPQDSGYSPHRREHAPPGPVDFRVPSAPSSVVSSSTCSPPIMMRPPPPPPPLKHRLEAKHHPHHPGSSHHEEPTSSMPDLGEPNIGLSYEAKYQLILTPSDLLIKFFGRNPPLFRQILHILLTS